MPRLNLTEDETRDLILDEADRLFTEIGYDKTTVADIARACGFSSSNVHRVFGTKAVINQAIAERKLQEKLAVARAKAATAKSAAEKLEMFVRTIHEATLDTFIANKRVHHMVAVAIEERWAPVQRYRLGLLDFAREVITEGVEQGEFQVSDIDGAARFFHNSALRFFHPLAVAEMECAEDTATFEVWMPMILRALGSEPLPLKPSS